MVRFLHAVSAVLGLSVALGTTALFANEPTCNVSDSSCCNLTDCVEAACQPCDECTSCDCCECDQSGWYGNVGAIFLTRDKSNAGRIIAANPAGTPFLTGANFDFDHQTGIDTTIARRFCNGNALEARFFSVDDVFASNTIVTPGNFIGVGFTGPAGTTAASRYWTQLKSIELNYKYAVNDRVSLLGGFRYLQLNDTLQTVLGNNVATGLYEFENEMYGGQLGADILLTDPCNSLEFRIIGKAGWYQNDYEGGIREFQGNNFIGSFVGAGEGTAFVGDIVIAGSYWLNDHLAIRAGYQFLWIGDVALAGEEASRSILNPNLLRNPLHDGDLFMHGALVGLEVQW